MFINTIVQIETLNSEDPIQYVDAEGRFYNGSLEDWWVDTDLAIDEKTSEYIIQKLYDEYMGAA